VAEVFLARMRGTLGITRRVVLKRILPHLAEDPEIRGLFLSEARIATQLDHPNIVHVFDFGETEDGYFLAMEFVDGPTLGALARRAIELGMPLPAAVCAKLVSFACEGLAYANERVSPETGAPMHLLHRDISPDNLMLSRSGAVKVVDFGIARVAGQVRGTKQGMLRGKLAYMPPERLRDGVENVQGDVFALGVVLYELLTGRKPISAKGDVEVLQAMLHQPFIPVRSRRPDVPLALQHILDKALAWEPRRRYRDCRELQADLEGFMASTGQPVSTFRLARLLEELDQQSTTRFPALPRLVPEQTPAPLALASPSLKGEGLGDGAHEERSAPTVLIRSVRGLRVSDVRAHREHDGSATGYPWHVGAGTAGGSNGGAGVPALGERERAPVPGRDERVAPGRGRSARGGWWARAWGAALVLAACFGVALSRPLLRVGVVSDPGPSSRPHPRCSPPTSREVETAPTDVPFCSVPRVGPGPGVGAPRTRRGSGTEVPFRSVPRVGRGPGVGGTTGRAEGVERRFHSAPFPAQAPVRAWEFPERAK
jgi:serine/threonine protein kinase